MKLPAGKYYISDPCYLVPDAEWSDFCDQFYDDNAEANVITLRNGSKVVAFNTAFGDGCYSDQLGNEYPVDAGLIGIIPFDAVPAPEHNSHWKTVVIDFPSAFSCSERDGVMTFGHVVINTGDEQ